MTWKLDIFGCGWHGGYLVDSGFFAQCVGTETKNCSFHCTVVVTLGHMREYLLQNGMQELLYLLHNFHTSITWINHENSQESFQSCLASFV